MTDWYQDIINSKTLALKFKEGMLKYRNAELRFVRGQRKHRPDVENYIEFYKGPDGRHYDWLQLREGYDARVRKEIKHELNTMLVPSVYTPAFQQFMLKQLNQKDAFADFIDLPMRNVRLLTYLKQISTTQEDGCTSKDTLSPANLLAHQAVVFAMARLRAAERIKTPGLLAMHSTGAGKTLEGLCAMLAFWNKKTSKGEPYALFTISTRSNQSSNDLEKLGAMASEFFGYLFVSEFEELERYPFKNKSAAEAAAVIRKRMAMGLRTIARDDDAFQLLMRRRRNEVYTYTTLSNDLSDGMFKRSGHDIRHALLIVDEVQFLLAPPADETAFASQYAELREYLLRGRDPATTWVLGMTATPGSTSGEVRQILDVIKAKKGHFKKGTDLATAARGLVSVARVEGDLHHFPILKVETRCVFLKPSSLYARRYIKSASQYPHLLEGLRDVAEDLVMTEEEKIQEREVRYQTRVVEYHRKMKAFKEDRSGDLKQPKEPHKKETLSPADDPKWSYRPDKRFSFYKRLRETSNYLTIRGAKDEMLELQQEFREEKVWSFIAVDGTCHDQVILMVLSPKLRKVVEGVKKGTGKHFIYTSDPMTLMLLATAFEVKLGMSQVKVQLRQQKAAEYEDDKKYFGVINKVSSTKKLDVGSRREFPLNRWEYITKPDTHIKVVKAAINESDNLKGEHVNVVLATKENFKGVDLKGLRYIHLIEPMPDFSDFIQLVGRGPRFCSHAGIKPISSWTVKLVAYRLLIDGVDDFVQADTHVYNESIRRYNTQYGAGTDTDLQKASVDYLVFKDNLHATVGQQRQQLMSMSCAKKKKDTLKKGGVPPPMSSSRKEQLRKKREHQKALIARRRHEQAQAG